MYILKLIFYTRMVSFRPFSCNYLRSRDSFDDEEEKYFFQVSNIATNTYTIKVYCYQGKVEHNFDNNYQQLIQFLLKNDNSYHFQSFNQINPLVLTCRNIRESFFAPYNCLEILNEFIQKKIPFFVLNDIINIWYEIFKTKIEKIISENKFDRDCYDLGSDDYNLAGLTIRNCEKVLLDVKKRLSIL